MNRMTSIRRGAPLWLALAFALSASERAAAQPFLYAATGSGGIGGSLYILDPTNGSIVNTVGPLVDAIGNAYGLTGLAWNPANNTLYGSTTTISPTAPRSLVTVDPLTARVTVVGPYTIPSGGTLSDITFQPGTNTLFGWSPVESALFTVNIATGATTQVGASVPGLQGGGALAFRSDGVLFAAPDALNSNTLRTINPATGAHTVIGPITGAGTSFLNAFAFNGSTLFGSLSPSPTAMSNLATVNTVTAAVTNLGPAVIGLDALEFVPIPEPSSVVLGGLAAAGLAFVRRKSRPARAV